MDDLGVPLFQETSKCVCVCIFRYIYIYTHCILGVCIYIYCVCVLWIYEVHSVVLFVCASISLFIFVFMYLFLILMHIDWQFQCILTEHIFENHINHQPHQLYRMLGTQFWPIISSIFACEAPSGRVNHTKYGKQTWDQHTFLYPHDISMLDG